MFLIFLCFRFAGMVRVHFPHDVECPCRNDSSSEKIASSEHFCSDGNGLHDGNNPTE